MADDIKTVPPPPRLPDDLRVSKGELERMGDRAKATTLTGAAHTWARRAREAEEQVRQVRASRRKVAAAAGCIGGLLGLLGQWIAGLF